VNPTGCRHLLRERRQVLDVAALWYECDYRPAAHPCDHLLGEGSNARGSVDDAEDQARDFHVRNLAYCGQSGAPRSAHVAD
jgi:hypothetical protein